MNSALPDFSFRAPIQNGFLVGVLIVASMLIGALTVLALQRISRWFTSLLNREPLTRGALQTRLDSNIHNQNAMSKFNGVSQSSASKANSSQTNSSQASSSQSDLANDHRNSSDAGTRLTLDAETDGRRSSLNKLGRSSPGETMPEGGKTNGNGQSQLTTVYQNFVEAHRSLLTLTGILLSSELILYALPHPDWYMFIEVPISLTLAIAISWLGSRLFRDFFDSYLLETAVREGRKLNSEFLILAKLLANGVIVLIAVVLFAQTHQINIFGLIASLGIGGLAVAFAAQKTLEQLLGGIVIYLDRPFVVDDYIGLPDGTFGRVESIGLRSTKVRTSGKGTLIIVPNSSLTQVNIENFTGAKKVMSIVYLNLHCLIPDDEKALIRQVILESTADIFGIDSRSTDVTFRPMPQESNRTQVQITFFILGSGEVSMGLRRQVLDLANQNVTQRLMDYGLQFDIEEPTIYVDAPITI